ncbi:MAG: LysR substrate-binding domain-containing protein, partial [Pseudomonadota bacterium]
VGELEGRLGVRLLQRTTRKVGLTPAGEDLLERAPALLAELDDVLAEAASGSRGVSGVIRVSAPVTFGEVYVAGMLGRFGLHHPDLVIDLRLTDKFADLAKDGIDLAFRIGTLETLSLKSRKIGTIEVIAAASDAYLDAHGMPQKPFDLEEHNCIIDTNRRTPNRWSFSDKGVDHSISITGRHMVNSARAACELAVADHGIVYGPRFALSHALREKRLTRILKGFSGEEIPISAVFLEGKVVPRKIRTLIEFAKADFLASECAAVQD